ILNEKSFAGKLLKVHSMCAGQTAVAIVDEMTTLRLLGELSKRRKADPEIKWQPVLVFPLATQSSLQHESKRNLPMFITGLATVWTGDEKLIAFLERGLRMLLAQTELVANLYHRLYEMLVSELNTRLQEVESADPGCHRRLHNTQKDLVRIERLWNEGTAIQFAQYALRLNSREPIDVIERLNLSWTPIIGRVREILPQPPEGTQSVREGHFRVGYLPLRPCAKQPKTIPD